MREPMSGLPISSDVIERENARRAAHLAEDYGALGHQLARRDVDLDAVKRKVAGLNLALPSWGVGTGGTRFARFPGPGEPRGIFEKLDDCAVVHQLGRATPTVSLHIPVGQSRPGRPPRESGGTRTRLRRHELQYVPGPPDRPAAAALLQVRFAVAHGRRRARPGRGPQYRVHRDRPRHRLGCADGLDRRRFQFPRPEPPDPQLRTLPRRHGSDLHGAAGELALVLGTQDVRAGLLLDRRAGLGHQSPDRPDAGSQGGMPRRSRPPRSPTSISR